MAIVTAVVWGYLLSSNLAFAVSGDHYEAKHCEIFVDKVVARRSSHGTHGIVFFLKTLNSRLDSPIAEVGIRQRVTEQLPRQPEPLTSPWHEESFRPYFGASDYFQGYVHLGSTYSTRSAEAVFYVRTAKGTNYWLKPRSGGNYQIGDSLYSRIRDISGLYTFISTQAEETLRDLNPGQCY
jgi:hypothetical protein